MDTSNQGDKFVSKTSLGVTLTYERDSLLGQMALSMSDEERAVWESRALRMMFEPSLEAINTGDSPTMIVTLS